MSHAPPPATAAVNASLLWVLCPDEPGLSATEATGKPLGQEAGTANWRERTADAAAPGGAACPARHSIAAKDA
jgi:hypothetical protein